MSSDYISEIKAVLRRNGVDEGLMPSVLLRKWESFIRDCEDGYSWDISEYSNEIGVRGVIELLLSASTLRGFRRLGEFRDAVEALDQRFRTLLQCGVTIPKRRTWRQGVLKMAGTAYADYIRKAYGFIVEPVG